MSDMNIMSSVNLVTLFKGRKGGMGRRGENVREENRGRKGVVGDYLIRALKI